MHNKESLLSQSWIAALADQCFTSQFQFVKYFTYIYIATYNSNGLILMTIINPLKMDVATCTCRWADKVPEDKARL